MPVPTVFGVSSKSFLNIARELTTGTPPSSGTTPSATIPIDKNDYSPEDTPKFLPDEAIRGVMAQLYNDIIGVEDATMGFGGPAFLDVEGYWCDNIFGDMTTTSGGTLGTGQLLTGSIAAGATTMTVASSLGSVTTGSIIQITDAGTGNEVVIATSGSTGTTINFVNTPTRFSHNTSATGALQTAATNYVHKWSILNTGTGQPPTHSVSDFTNLTASVGARTYPSVCLSQLDFTGNAEQLLMTKVAGNSWLSAAAASTPTAATTFVKPQAGWESTVTVGGSQIYSAGEWQCSIKRQLQIYWTAQNSQTPYIIARGGLGATAGINYTVPGDETPLTNMLTGGPMAVQFSISNGGSGAGLLSMTITMTKAQSVKAKPARNAVLIGYDTSWEATANTTDVGGSGGLGPLTVSITNATATY